VEEIGRDFSPALESVETYPHPPRCAWSPLPTRGRETQNISICLAGTFSRDIPPTCGEGGPAEGRWVGVVRWTTDEPLYSVPPLNGPLTGCHPSESWGPVVRGLGGRVGHRAQGELGPILRWDDSWWWGATGAICRLCLRLEASQGEGRTTESGGAGVGWTRAGAAGGLPWAGGWSTRRGQFSGMTCRA